MAIPEGWSELRLGDAAEFVNGRAFKPSDWSPSGVPIIRIQNLNGGGVFNYYRGECEDRYLVSAGCLLFSWSGTRGTSFGAHLWMGPTAILNQHIFKVEQLQGVEKSFFFHELRHITSDIEKKAHGGTGIVHITKGQLEDFTFLCPPLPEQKKIAAILSSVDEVIAKTEAVIAQLQIVKKAMMEQLLTKGMPGRHTRFKQTEIGEIPEEWEVVSVRDVAKSVVPGRNKPSVFDGTIPWLTIADLQHTVVTDSSAGLRVSQTELNNCGGKTVPAGTVIMSCVGRLGIVSISGCIVTMNQQLHGFACGPSIDPLFLCLVLRSAERQMQALAGKTTIPYLNKARCEEIVIPLPCLPEQRAVAEQIAPIETSLASEEAVLLQMRHLKSALSSSLLSGELRVIPEVAE